MAANLNGDLRVQGQILDLKPEKRVADPALNTLAEPRLWFNDTDKELKLFNGAEVIALTEGLTEAEVNTAVETALTPYAKTADVTAEIGTATADLVSDTELTAALVPYAQKTEVTSEIGTAVQNLVSETALQNALENALTGLDYQKDVIAARTTEFNGIEGRYIYDGVNGATAVDGDTIGVNDIVYVDSSNSILRVEYDVSVAGEGALVWNRNGETGDGSAHWLRWDGQTWDRFGGLTEIQINDSLSKNANILGLKVDGDSLIVSANGVKVGDLSSVYVTPAALTAAIANFVTAAQVGTQISTALEDYSTTTEVQSAIDASLVPYAKTADVTTAINTATAGLASDDDLTAAVADLVSETALTAALVPYAQKTEVTTEIGTAVQNLVSETDLQNALENAVAGLDYQEDVLGFDTDFTVAGRYVSTGVTGDVNDIVVLDGSGSFASTAYDVSAAGPGALVWNRTGKTNAPNGYWLRWDGVNWAEFGGLQSVSAGDGIEKNGDVITVKLADASLVKGANGLQVGDLSGVYTTNTNLSTTLADYATTAAVTGQIADAVSPLATQTALDAVETNVQASFFPYSATAAATSHVVAHGLGYRYPIVQVIDKATNKAIIPDDIDYTNVNSLTVTVGFAADLAVSVSWYKTV